MVTQDLIDNISRRFRQGQTREEIKQALVDEGWEDVDVDEAISHIQKTALSQLPFVSAYTDFMSKLDDKTAHLSMPAVLGVCGVFAVIVLVIAFILYNVLDPFNIKSAERDTQRLAELKQMQTALQKYFGDKDTYPTSLDQLAPSYLSSVPQDPKSKRAYDYVPLDNQNNYELCVMFETHPVECISATPSNIIPTVLPDDMTDDTTVASIITGMVFLDSNADGKYDIDAQETPYPNAAIKIVDSSSKTVCEVTTDSTGTFLCNLAKDGTYQVTLEEPTGYRATPRNTKAVVMPDPSDPGKKSAVVSFGIVPLVSPATQNGL